MIVHPQVRAFLLQRELDFAAVLEGLTVPVLVAHGRSDIVVLPAMGDYILQQCKTAEPSWYDGIGHAPFLEEPQRFNRELARFAARAHGHNQCRSWTTCVPTPTILMCPQRQTHAGEELRRQFHGVPTRALAAGRGGRN
jgi:hypothetical protein